MNLLSKLKSLRPQIAAAAQAEYDAWTGDGEDPELGAGGPCDRIANEIGNVLAGAGIDSTDGGQDGDDHAFLIAYDEKDAYVVDIPPGVYERGSGYNWKKIPDVTFEVNDVVLEEFPRDQLDGHVTEENSGNHRGKTISWRDDKLKVNAEITVYNNGVAGIESFSSLVHGKGNAEKALLKISGEYGTVYADGIGRPGDDSYNFWLKMIRKGIVSHAVDDDGNEINGNGRVEDNPPIDFKKIDLQARFDALNKSVFGGELPQIPLSFMKSKFASGQTDIRVVSKGSSISLLRLLNRVSPADATITITGIKLNNVRTYDESEFDGILIHEMIHALVALRGYPFEHHGLHFLTMRRELQEKTGIKIPVSHDLSEAGIDAKEREVGLMVLGKREGEQYEAFLMFQLKALDAFMERYDASYARSWRTSIRFYLLHTKAWAATTVKTKPDKYGVKLQWLKPALGIDLSNAWLAREVRYAGATESSREKTA